MTDLSPAPLPVTPGHATPLNRLRRMLDGYDRRQKLVAVGAVLAVIAGIMVVSRLGGGSSYEILFSDLEPADAAAITEELTARGVPYELAAGGGTILVPADQLYQTRLAVSEVALPSNSTVGYGVLDNQGMGASEFDQRVGFQRAMEGELAKTIESIGSVQDAVVHLAIPQQSAFVSKPKEASASVLVRTRRGQTLTPNQVEAIVNLVSASIENLPPEQVTVADADGNVLAAAGQGVGSSPAGKQRDTAEFEQSVARSIEDMVEAVAGPGAARVTVAAQLDFDEASTTRETFEPPAQQAPNSLRLEESNRNETYTGSGAATGGILGPDTPGNEAGGTQTDYTLEETDVRYAVNRVVESTNKAPGQIERLSVAVLVDEDKVPQNAIAPLTELILAGAGIDTARGDQLSVNRLPFDTSQARQAQRELEARKAEARAERTHDLLRQIALVLLVAVVVVVALLMQRRAQRRKAANEALFAELRAGLEPLHLSPGPPAPVGVLDDEPDHRLPVPEPEYAESLAATASPAPLALPVDPSPAVSEEDLQRIRQRERAIELAEQHPDEVAALVRGWLSERRRNR